MTAIAEPETAQGFRAGDRHGLLDSICSRMEAILLGQAAEALLAASAELPIVGALAVLPCWAWVSPGDCVGRKGRTRDGSGFLMLPARLTTSTGPLVVVPTGGVVGLDWDYLGSGREDSGHTRVESAVHTVADAADDYRSGGLPGIVHATDLTRRQIIKRLKEIAEDGKIAHWQLLITLERNVTRAVESAHNAVVAEINDIALDSWSAPIKLDAPALEDVVSEIVYGKPDKPLEESVLAKMIEKMITPGKLAKVDPLMYLTVNLRRDAEAVVRRRFGDPHIGPKVRQIARSMPGADHEQILAAYRQRYPADRAGLDRISAALSIAPTSAVHIEEGHVSGDRHLLDDVADAVIDRIDTARAVAARNQVSRIDTEAVLPAPAPLTRPLPQPLPTPRTSVAAVPVPTPVASARPRKPISHASTPKAVRSRTSVAALASSSVSSTAPVARAVRHAAQPSSAAPSVMATTTAESLR